jgi:hypothetical protein
LNGLSVIDGSIAKLQKMFVVIRVAPLGLIGVVMALLPTGTRHFPVLTLLRPPTTPATIETGGDRDDE